MVEAERRERRSLGLIAQVSDLLMDLDDPHALREIATILRRAVVGWAAFYLNDGGLRVADGIDAGRPPTGQGRAARRRAPTPCGTRGPDAVQQLLDAETDRPVELDARTAPTAPGSASAWLAEHGRAPGWAPTTPAPRTRRARSSSSRCPGRRRVLGVLVVHARDGRGLRGPGAVRAHGPGPDGPPRRAGHRQRAPLRARAPARRDAAARDAPRAGRGRRASTCGRYYAPNSEHAQVGGDWYDVLQVTPDVVGVVIGDVVGHDVEAAAVDGPAALGRPLLRLRRSRRPGPVLERVDQLVAGMRIPRSASLVLCHAERAADGRLGGWTTRARATCRRSCVRAGEVTQLDAARRAAHRLRRRAARARARSTSSPATSLVFYTDGLIERRDRALRDGLAALLGGGRRPSPRATRRASARSCCPGSRTHPEDDVARRGRAGARRRWTTAGRDRAARAGGAGRCRARRRRSAGPGTPCVRTCQAWGIEDAANAELVVSELVANAVLHGWGHVSLRLYDTGRRPAHRGRGRQPRAAGRHRRAPGRVGGLRHADRRAARRLGLAAVARRQAGVGEGAPTGGPVPARRA